jgi:hypothetical protein
MRDYLINKGHENIVNEITKISEWWGEVFGKEEADKLEENLYLRAYQVISSKWYV